MDIGASTQLGPAAHLHRPCVVVVQVPVPTGFGLSTRVFAEVYPIVTCCSPVSACIYNAVVTVAVDMFWRFQRVTIPLFWRDKPTCVLEHFETYFFNTLPFLHPSEITESFLTLMLSIPLVTHIVPNCEFPSPFWRIEFLAPIDFLEDSL